MFGFGWFPFGLILLVTIQVSLSAFGDSALGSAVNWFIAYVLPVAFMLWIAIIVGTTAFYGCLRLMREPQKT